MRIRRAPAPEPPFWCATTVAPYSARRGSPVSIDYIELRASGAERLDVNVSERPADELERATRIAPPILVESSGFAETVFRRGEEIVGFCRDRALEHTQLVSTGGACSQPDATVVAAWPLDLAVLEQLFATASGHWGVAIPVIFPVTTDLGALRELTAVAKNAGAEFLATIPVEIDATAKQAIARSLALDGDDETYAMLFHSNLEPIHVATERHVAALAADGGMEDFVVPPRWNERTNWNAAIVLMLAATRLLAMEEDVDLAALLARSARVVADLDKPLSRIAEAASLSIVEAIDAASADILTEWLESGRSRYIDRVNARWRLRRV
ncbi:MAG TPA: hypothetical protein VLU46_04705 [Thermoanaerobaculia bacterium]|nr:hypothetical protein [Thermoanaerobaculia bacterium]